MLLVLLVRAQLQISEKPTNEIGKCGFWWQRPEKLDYFCSQIAPSQHLVLLQILYFSILHQSTVQLYSCTVVQNFVQVYLFDFRKLFLLPDCGQPASRPAANLIFLQNQNDCSISEKNILAPRLLSASASLCCKFGICPFSAAIKVIV